MKQNYIIGNGTAKSIYQTKKKEKYDKNIFTISDCIIPQIVTSLLTENDNVQSCCILENLTHVLILLQE